MNRQSNSDALDSPVAVGDTPSVVTSSSHPSGSSPAIDSSLAGDQSHAVTTGVKATEAGRPAIDSPGNSSSNSQTASSPDASKKKQDSRRWVAWLVGFLIFLIVALVASLFYWAAASVGGVELNVATWQTRHFFFLRDPFTDTQLTNIEHSYARQFSLGPSIAAHIGGGSIRPAQPRWDLVSIHRGARFGEGDAAILLNYLQASDRSSSPYWETWTNANAQAAPILWGAVRDAVHLGRYDRLPQLFEAARADRDPATLKPNIDQIMLDLAIDEARAKEAAGDEAAARRAAVMGLAYGSSTLLQALVDKPSQPR